MPRLSLALLGRPEARLSGQTVRFPTRKTFALLIYLAASPGRHSRESLMALLWPESDAPHGQASLRNTLARLRRSVPGPCLLIDDESAGFNFDADYALDLETLEENTVAQGSPAALAAATDGYRGEFLSGFSLPDAPEFEEWARVQREHWRRHQCRALERLAVAQSESGDGQAALATAARWVAADPFNEAAYQLLMRLQFAAGNKSGALETYAAAREALQRELSIGPSPETEALAARIRRETAAPAPARRPERSGPAELPFVGRAAEYARLIQVYQDTAVGRPQAAILEGEAGIGKTRLAGEFLAWAAAQGADVVRGRAFEAGGRLPYQPVVEALRARLDRENAPDDLLEDAWLAELSRLLPELRERYPDLPPALPDDALAAGRMMEAVARLTLALAARAPVIFFLDDLQWADSASLDLLHYLARRWASAAGEASRAAAPILMLATLRSEALANQPALRDWLANLGRDGSLARLPLEPITAGEVRKLLDRLPEAGASAAGLADWLFAETRGQPLYLSETLKILSERGPLIAASTAALRGLIPPGVRDVILYRLGRLSDAARGLLVAAAVLGRSFSFERMRAVAEAAEREALPALDELLAGRILVDRGGRAHEPYEFAHDKIRDVVYTEAGEARRRHTHRLAYQALLADGAAEAELAHHALGAHLVEPGVRHSLAAGDAALGVFAVRDAIALYEQARRAEPAGLPVALFSKLGRAYELAGDHARARAAYQQMLERASDSGQPGQACAALNHLATVAIHQYDFTAAAGWLEQAQAIAQAVGNAAALADTEWSLAQLHHHQYDFQQSRTHSARALAMARELGNAELTAGSLNALGYAEMLIGQVAAGSEHMEEARALYRQMGNRALEADCLGAIAAARLWLGQLEASLAASGEAGAISEAIENPWGIVFSGIWRAAALLDQGEYESALATAEAGEAQARAHDFVPIRIFNLLTLGRARRALMQPEAAHAANLEAQAVHDRAPAGPFAEMISAALCEDAAAIDDWDAALEHARAAVSRRSYAALPLVVPLRWPETAALLRGGERAVAEEDARRWGELVRDVPRLRLAHLRSLAVLEHGSSARAYLEEAAELAASLGLPGELWPICAALGQADRAQAIVRALADKFLDDAVRAGYLAGAAAELRQSTGLVAP